MDPNKAGNLFNLKWDNRNQIVSNKSFQCYLQNDFTDCLLSAEGNFLACHQIVLATSSPYFDNIFRSKLCGPNPVLIFHDLKFEDIVATMTYIYTGEVKVTEDKIASLTNAMVALQVPNAKQFHEFSKAKHGDDIKSESMSVDGDKLSEKSAVNELIDILDIKHLETTADPVEDTLVITDLLLENDLVPNPKFDQEMMMMTSVPADAMAEQEEMMMTPALDITTTEPEDMNLDTEILAKSPLKTITVYKPKFIPEVQENDATEETGKDLNEPTETEIPTNNIEEPSQHEQVSTSAKRIKKEKLEASRLSSSSKTVIPAIDPSMITFRKAKKKKPRKTSVEADELILDDSYATTDRTNETSKSKKRKLNNDTNEADLEMDTSEAHDESGVKIRRCKYCGMQIDGSPSTVKQEKKKHQKVCPENPRLKVTSCPFCEIELQEVELNSHFEAEHGM